MWFRRATPAQTTPRIITRRTQVGSGGVPFTQTWYFIVYNRQLISLNLYDPETLDALDGVVESLQFE